MPVVKGNVQNKHKELRDKCNVSGKKSMICPTLNGKQGSRLQGSPVGLLILLEILIFLSWLLCTYYEIITKIHFAQTGLGV